MEGSDVGGVSAVIDRREEDAAMNKADESSAMNKADESSAMNNADESSADCALGVKMILGGFNRSDRADYNGAHEPLTRSAQIEYSSDQLKLMVAQATEKLEEKIEELEKKIEELRDQCQLKSDELAKARKYDHAPVVLQMCLGWIVASTVMSNDIRSYFPILYTTLTLLVSLAFFGIQIGFHMYERVPKVGRALKGVGIVSGFVAIFVAFPPLVGCVFSLFWVTIACGVFAFDFVGHYSLHPHVV